MLVPCAKILHIIECVAQLDGPVHGAYNVTWVKNMGSICPRCSRRPKQSIQTVSVFGNAQISKRCVPTTTVNTTPPKMDKRNCCNFVICTTCTCQSEMSTFVFRSLEKYILLTKLQQFLMLLVLFMQVFMVVVGT